MAPLAGKPPFATDEPDSFYDSAQSVRPRIRQQPSPDPNKRTSAYNVYDNYLDPNAKDVTQDNRQSGIGAVGMGLLSMDSDDDSDDEDSHQPTTPVNSTSKHAALAAATSTSPQRAQPDPVRMPQTQQQIQPQQQQIVPTIAAPRPGYAAPIAALNLARPPQAAASPMQAINPFDPQPQRQLQNPFEPFPTSPSPSLLSSTPHPLQPPMTPITPVFARPAKSPTAPGITFSTPIPRNKPIMRGKEEETLLPTRGQKGDDFWRRFSMIAKEEGKKPSALKQSTWLRKTQSGSTRLSRWVWIIGIILLLCIGGAAGLAYWRTRNVPNHQQPTAIGGSANEKASAAPTSTAKANGSTGLPGSSIPHVSPTHTVARRSSPTALVQVRQIKSLHRKRLELDTY